jgi:hypothetical protein
MSSQFRSSAPYTSRSINFDDANISNLVPDLLLAYLRTYVNARDKGWQSAENFRQELLERVVTQLEHHFTFPHHTSMSKLNLRIILRVRVKLCAIVIDKLLKHFQMAARSWFDNRTPPRAATSTTDAVDAGPLWYPGLTDTVHYPHSAVQARENHGQVPAYATIRPCKSHRDRTHAPASDRGAPDWFARSSTSLPPRGKESRLAPGHLRSIPIPQLPIPPELSLAARSPVSTRPASAVNTPTPRRPALSSGWTSQVAYTLAPNSTLSSASPAVVVNESSMLPTSHEAAIVKGETISAPPMGTRVGDSRLNASSATPTSLSTSLYDIPETRLTMQELFLLGRGQPCPRKPTTYALSERPDAARVRAPQALDQYVASSSGHAHEALEYPRTSGGNDDIASPTSSNTTSSLNHNSLSQEHGVPPYATTGSISVNVSEDEKASVIFPSHSSFSSSVLAHDPNAEGGEDSQCLSIHATQLGASEPGNHEVPDVKYPGYVWVACPKSPPRIVDVVAILPRCTRSGRQF